MNKIPQFLLIAIFFALALRLPADEAPQTQSVLRVEGAVETAQEWTNERLSREFAKDIKTVSYMLKGVKGKARCLPLLTLVQAAKPRLNPKIKNHQLAFVFIASGADGYTVAFSMAELLPQYGARKVWLALDRDGKPLPPKAAPVELIAPDDGKPSRWAHGVVRLRVVDGAERG